ncbi:hypothetical protein [Streptomyces sp. NPDC058272]|uniref:hypothetical protein n=1 Tax=Streptomyces sp. NPDC058272 TaxID=3346415 RepID=UPI0036E3E890
MSEYQDHVRQSLEGQNVDPSEDLGIDAMRWTPEPASDDVPEGALQAAADQAHQLLDRAVEAYSALVFEVLGEGAHHMVVSVTAPHHEFLEGQHLTVMGGAIAIDEAEALRVCAAIAAGMVESARGGVVVRTFGPNGSESVRAWAVRHGWLRPLTADQVREAYSADPTGAPLAPEPGVEYRQAERVPRPDQAEAQTRTESASHTAPRDNRPPNRRN